MPRKYPFSEITGALYFYFLFVLSHLGLFISGTLKLCLCYGEQHSSDVSIYYKDNISIGHSERKDT
jgi:hypothetical protein